MKKTVFLGVCLSLLSFGCQSQEQTHGKTQRMQPQGETQQDQNFHERRKVPRSQGGCCGAEELQAPGKAKETAEAPEVKVETSSK